MKFLILSFALAVTTGSAFVVAPTNKRCKSSTSSSLKAWNDIYSMVGTIEGPSVAWGYEGKKVGRFEDEIKGYDNFDFFRAALDQAGLKNTLKGIGPYTLLAPTDAACFAYQGCLDEDILKYHIILGKHESNSFLTTGSSCDYKYETLNGESLTYTRKYRKDFLDDAIIGMIGEIGQTPYPCDIECDNGVIHAIDRVLIPGYKGVAIHTTKIEQGGQ
jgi:uncharacterized surface protein with fasciclin (FAS1) repeats